MIGVIFLILVIFCMTELPALGVYGKIIPTDIVNKALDQHIPKGAELNSIDNDIFTIGEMPYISTNRSIFGHYHISDVGRVRTFSSAHKRISKIHKELIEQSKPKQKTIEQKLNIK